MESRRRIFGSPLHRKDNKYFSVRFDLGRNFIHAGRYSVSGTGNVIDLKTARILTDHGDNLIKATPETLIFRRDNIEIGTGYLRLELPGGEYGFDNKLHFPEGELSPDFRHGLVSHYDLPHRVEIIGPEGSIIQTLRLDDGGLRTGGSEFTKIPIAWTSNMTFAYARRQEKSVSVLEYDLERQQACSLGVIEQFKFNGPSDFETDCEGATIFKCPKGAFLLDRSSKQLRPYTIRPLGHDFSTTQEYQEMRPLYYQGRPIGSFPCSTWNAQTADGYLAVAYGENFRDGFKVWNASTGKWLTFKLPFFCSFVGWCEPF